MCIMHHVHLVHLVHLVLQSQQLSLPHLSLSVCAVVLKLEFLLELCVIKKCLVEGGGGHFTE